MATTMDDLEPATQPLASGQWNGSAETRLQRRQPAGMLAIEAPGQPLLPGTDEVFRGIYTRAGVGFASEILAVCSAIAGEGRTTLSLGLAITMAQDFPDRRVLLVETDLQQPILASDFELEPAPGLTECLLKGQPIQTACRPTYLENLDLLPAGGPPGRAGRLLRSAQMVTTIESLRQAYDLVVLDMPAMLVNSDAVVLADLADILVFVVRAGVTPSALVRKAVEQLDESKLCGYVLNDLRSSTPGWLRRLCGL
jgi:capsular exopolysaccharide synthesis family protein